MEGKVKVRGVIRRMRPLSMKEIAQAVSIAEAVRRRGKLGVIRRMVSLDLARRRQEERHGSSGPD